MYAKKLDNQNEMDNFLETWNLLRLNYEETKNINKPITRTSKIKFKERKIMSVDKDVGKLEPLCTAGWNVKWHSHCKQIKKKKKFGGSSKS